MLVQWGWFVLGAVLLVLGSDSLVKGAAGLALGLRWKPFLVGFFVLGFGTALPELAVNLEAMRSGHPGLALGNVVGSNIANLGLVLGCAALFAPFATGLRASGVLLPLIVIAAIALGVLGFDGALSRLDGALLLLLFVVGLVLVWRRAGSEPAPVQATFSAAVATRQGAGLGVMRIVMGAAIMGGGVYLAVGAAAALAQSWGWSDLLVGLTLVAIGTLLPELFTAVLAARRGHGDLAIGNALGGSFANLGLVLGTSALWSPIPVPRQLLQVELPALALFALALYPMIRGDAHLSRREGGILLGAYIAFLAWQAVLASS
jgi:cation:H+ antiporter